MNVKGSSNGMFSFAAEVSGSCFGGACVIKWLPQTLLTDARAEKITAAVKACPEYTGSTELLDAATKENVLSEWAVMLSCLFDIQATAGVSVYADALAKWFVSQYNPDDPGGIWLARINMPYQIFKEIRAAWRIAQEPINPPEKLPGTALNAEQLEQLKDKNSPLASAADNGGKARGN